MPPQFREQQRHEILSRRALCESRGHGNREFLSAQLSLNSVKDQSGAGRWIEAAFRRALALTPSYAPAHDQFGMGLAFQGKLDEAIDEGRRAAELDPLSPQILLDATLAFAWKRDYATARQLVQKASDLDQTYFLAPWMAGWIDLQSGHVEDAVAQFEKAEGVGSPAFVSAWLAYAHGVSGSRARATAGLDALKKRSLRGVPTAFDLALVHLGLGDHASALSHLERAHATDSEWLGWLGADRIFDPLRPEPRFAALIRKLGLEGVRERVTGEAFAVACAKHQVTPNLAAYTEGRERGLREYCQPKNGFSVGLAGGGSANVCPVPTEAAFVGAYQSGRQIYAARSELRSTHAKLRGARDGLAHTDAAMASVTTELVLP